MRLGYHLARYDLTTREKLIKGANTEILRAVPREKISNKRWGYLQEKMVDSRKSSNGAREATRHKASRRGDKPLQNQTKVRVET